MDVVEKAMKRLRQASASIGVAINDDMERAAPRLMVHTMSHTVTQLAEPIPAVVGIGNPGLEYFVVTALVTFTTVP